MLMTVTVRDMVDCAGCSQIFLAVPANLYLNSQPATRSKNDGTKTFAQFHINLLTQATTMRLNERANSNLSLLNAKWRPVSHVAKECHTSKHSHSRIRHFWDIFPKEFANAVPAFSNVFLVEPVLRHERADSVVMLQVELLYFLLPNAVKSTAWELAEKAFAQGSNHAHETRPERISCPGKKGKNW